MGTNVKWLCGVSTICLLSLASLTAASPDLRLVEAVKHRDAEAARALLQAGVDVNTAQPDGATALHWAAHWDDVETAKQLIRAGARLDATNDYGVTPLSLACSDAGGAMVETLLEAGADPNAVLPSGETPLMTAARADNLGGVKALLARGVDVNIKEATHGQTALMWALSRNHLVVARTLVDSGADVTARTDTGFTPLMFASRKGNIDAARMLIAHGADVNEAAPDGAGGRSRRSQEQPDAPAQISPLLVATVRGHSQLAAFFLEQGADPNFDEAGYTALHWAAGTWESQTTRDYVVSVVRESEWGSLAGLHGEEKLDLITALLAHGADPNAQTTRAVPRFGWSYHAGSSVGGSSVGGTPFFFAAMVADLPVMRLLVEGGADPLTPATDGTTPLMVAAGLTNVEEEHTIPESRHLDAVKLCLELGADIEAKNEKGNTALHATAMLGYPTVTQFLIDSGADMNPTNINGETPLKVAEGTYINTQVFVHENVAELLRTLGGVSAGVHPRIKESLDSGGLSITVDTNEETPQEP